MLINFCKNNTDVETETASGNSSVKDSIIEIKDTINIIIYDDNKKLIDKNSKEKQDSLPKNTQEPNRKTEIEKIRYSFDEDYEKQKQRMEEKRNRCNEF